MDLASIHFHDTKILRVTEDCSTDQLIMEVSYPVDWQSNRFEPKHLVFENAYNYQVFEQPFDGCPTILDASLTDVDGIWYRIRLETNAGTREVVCQDVKIR